jgi:hypothetical protein
MMAFRRNRGLRIDHILLSAPLAAECTACVDRQSPAQAGTPLRPCAGNGNGTGMSVPAPTRSRLYPVLANCRRIAAGNRRQPADPVACRREPRVRRTPALQGFPFILDGAIRVAKVSASGRELPLYRVTPAKPASSPRAACSATPTTTPAASTESDNAGIAAARPVRRSAGRARISRFRLRAVRRAHGRTDAAGRRSRLPQAGPAPRRAAAGQGPRRAHHPPAAWPTNWAACAKWSAACSRASPNRVWCGSGASRWKCSTRRACAGSPL